MEWRGDVLESLGDRVVGSTGPGKGERVEVEYEEGPQLPQRRVQDEV